MKQVKEDINEETVINSGVDVAEFKAANKTVGKNKKENTDSQTIPLPPEWYY
ncbi:hypothetical protein JCM14036_05290 [Desulfotomaculum defluvii]